MSVDLEINNYNLEDILNLFKLPVNFDEQDLKRAKQVVLKTHPDKSGLESKYFLFYSKAYKMLYSLWDFRKKGDVNKNSTITEYEDVDKFSEEDKKKILDNLFKSDNTKTKFKTSRDFNSWFNEQFEKNKVYNENEESGYGDWLKTNEGLDEVNPNVSAATMKTEFDKKKSSIRALVVHKDVSELNSWNSINASELTREGPGEFSSDLFSRLPFQDLQKAHTETVIPVTDEDYDNIPKFKNVNEYLNHRNKVDITPLSEQQAQQYLNQQNDKDSEKAVRRAYELAKQSEIAKQKSQSFWGNLQFLQNK
jgi:hypothetical protein